MYSDSQMAMINNLYSVATDEELEESYFQIKEKKVPEILAIEGVILDEIKERVSKEVTKNKVMEPDYYAGA